MTVVPAMATAPLWLTAPALVTSRFPPTLVAPKLVVPPLSTVSSFVMAPSTLPARPETAHIQVPAHDRRAEARPAAALHRQVVRDGAVHHHRTARPPRAAPFPYPALFRSVGVHQRDARALRRHRARKVVA